MDRAAKGTNWRKLFNIICVLCLLGYAGIMVLNGIALSQHSIAANAPLNPAWWVKWSPAYAIFLFIALGSGLLSRISRKA